MHPQFFLVAALVASALAMPAHHETMRKTKQLSLEEKYDAVIATTTLPTREKIEFDKTCKYTREDCIDCATRHADLDADGKINRTEVDALKMRMLTWWQRDLAWFARYTTDYIMFRCADAYDFITVESLHAKRNLCLQHCGDWLNFMNLCAPLDKH